MGMSRASGWYAASRHVMVVVVGLWACCAQLSMASVPLRVRFDVEEFNGQMPGWANIKQYGAAGDGVTDDTVAFKAALADLGRRAVFGDASYHPEYDRAGSPVTLYLPAGTYKISETLNIVHRAAVNLVGEDPARTRILWAGPDDGTMLITDGNLAGRFQRLTWDGAGKAGIGVAHWYNHYQATIGDYYGGSSQHIDEVFTDMKVGITAGCCFAGDNGVANAVTHPGTRVNADFDLRVNHKQDYITDPARYWAYADYNELDSEGSVIRTRFIRNSRAGVNIDSSNALNWWIVDSQFEDCATGVTNYPGNGNFLLYRNTFLRSTNTDVELHNLGGWFALHDNVSYQSKRFYTAYEIGRSGSPVILQNNRIINPTSVSPIYNGNTGPLMLIDNQIKSPPSSTGFVIEQQDWEAGRDIFTLGNSFTVPAAQQVKMRYGCNYGGCWSVPQDRLRRIGDKQVDRSQISEAVPMAVDASPTVERRIFVVPTHVQHLVYGDQAVDVPVGTGLEIQATIDAAIASGEDSPIVFLPVASYGLTQSIRVPALHRLQLVGDGGHTNLRRADGASFVGALIELEGPSLATLKDFALESSLNTAIHLGNADQDGGQVFINGWFGGPLHTSGLLRTRVSALANTGLSIDARNTASLVAVGQNLGYIQSQDNSRVVVMDSWKESSGTLVAAAQGGAVSIMGAHFSTQLPNHQTSNSQTPSVALNDFSGHFTMAGVGYDMSGGDSNNGLTVGQERQATPGEPGTNALFLGVGANTLNYYARQGSGGRVGFALMKQGAPYGGSLTSNPDDVGQTDDDAVVDGLTQLRGVQWDRAPSQAPVGATDVRIYRIFAANAQDGIAIDGPSVDCLGQEGDILPVGESYSVIRNLSSGVRMATVVECPYGGMVPTTTVVRQQMLCSGAHIVESGIAQGSTSDAGAPVCNFPIACTDSAGISHADGLAFLLLGVPVLSSRAATSQECAVGGTVHIAMAEKQTYACHQGQLTAWGEPSTQVTETVACIAAGDPTGSGTATHDGDTDVPLPIWSTGLLAFGLVAMMRRRGLPAER
jgi:hypothetical protein